MARGKNALGGLYRSFLMTLFALLVSAIFLGSSGFAQPSKLSNDRLAAILLLGDHSIDSDGDGVLDLEDVFPDNQLEWLDTDGDGIGNNKDLDDDNDGFPDLDDPAPLNPDITGVINDLAPFVDRNRVSKFLSRATFGAESNELDNLEATGVSSWLTDQFAKPKSSYLAVLDEYQGRLPFIEFNLWNEASTTFAFWKNTLLGEDQLRQRMMFALSQILVVSNAGGDQLTDIPEATAYHQEILQIHAFGNYRELLEAITYSPGMGFYLTYMGNQKGNPQTGRQPDENYARELLQLFTVGLVALNPDGSVKLDQNGSAIELYNNDDITGLAKVFTGLDRTFPEEDGGEDPEVLKSWREPMVIYPELHSSLDKSFLGLTIPENTGAALSIDLALDHIMQHPSVGPFIGRQLIQRFTTSNPSPAYVRRVASAFDRGSFTLPNGVVVGDGRKGDLKATLSAILLDPETIDPVDPQRFGKLKEPVLRFTQWARAFSAGTVTPEYTTELYDLSSPSDLGQHPFRASSVFNFYRPGYVPSGTESGAAGMTAPEFQITNASTIPGYINLITFFAHSRTQEADLEEYTDLASVIEVDFAPELTRSSFVPNYEKELALASDEQALVTHLDTLLTGGTLSPDARLTIQQYVGAISLNEVEDVDVALEQRVALAVTLVMSSPDYWVLN